MKGLKHVIQFEYLNVVRRKAYLFSILFYLILMVVLSFLPTIIDLFSSDDLEINHSVALLLDETPERSMDINLIAEFFPEFDWQPTTAEEIENAITSGQGAFGVHFITPASYRVITTDSHFAPTTHIMELFVREVAHRYLFDMMEINHVTNIAVDAHWYIVNLAQEDGEGAGGDYNWIGPAGAVVGIAALILTLMAVMSSGGGILASVMKEKTSKIVELLFTSASPTAIMLGKVIASALVGLTTGSILAISIFVMTRFTNPLGELFGGGDLFYGYPMITFVYLIVFFVLAFVCLAFIYAAMAATVGDSQESATLATVPMFVVMGSFYLGMLIHGNPSFISETFVTAVSYVPFVSPFVMIARLNTVIMPAWEVLLIIGVNIVYTIVIAFVSAKIYQMCIMLFGHKITLRFLFKKLIKG
ncbi:MAG: ABC transporter permease [Defluviitaleaceae bacterium]|nr:ABC transporter permease [Defluviitaleaceae bacterium]